MFRAVSLSVVLAVLLALSGCSRGQLIEIYLVTVTSAGQPVQSLPPGVDPTIYSQKNLSSDGRYVLFSSHAAYDPADVNGAVDCYVYDRAARTTELVSVGTDGTLATSDCTPADISGDGRYVVFATSSVLNTGDSGSRKIYLRDRDTQTTTFVVQASPFYMTISEDGTRLAYSDNDLYVVDLLDIPAGPQHVADDTHAPWLSADGRYVAYNSKAGNAGLGVAAGVDFVYVADTSVVPFSYRWFGTDTNGNTVTGNSRVFGISADGSVIVFESYASFTQAGGGLFTISDVHGLNPVVNLVTSEYGMSTGASISADGRFVVYADRTSNQSLVLDRTLHTVEPAAFRRDGREARVDGTAIISKDGEWIMYVGGISMTQVLGTLMFGDLPIGGLQLYLFRRP
ncbi:MAG: hypothetical protein AB7K09_21335 [Planctomycetota bacterium]